MDITSLNKNLNKEIVQNIYLFYGAEAYLKNHYMNKIESIVLSDGLSMVNKIVLSGVLNINDLINTCETLPFGGGNKLIILKQCNCFKSENKAKSDELLNYLRVLPSYNYIIFYEEELNIRSKLVRSINEIGTSVEFDIQKPAALTTWSINIFKSLGKQINAQTASKFIHYCEKDMFSILNEINKIASFVGKRTEICNEDLDIISTKSINSKIFDLTNAMATKDCTNSLKLLHDMIYLKEPLPKILFMIGKQFTQILQIKLLSTEKSNISALANKMNLSTYAASKLLSLSSRFSLPELKDTLKQILKTDLSIKTTGINGELTLELLVTHICTSK